MTNILIIAGFFIIKIGAAGWRGSVSHRRDWTKEGCEKMRVGDKEYWV